MPFPRQIFSKLEAVIKDSHFVYAKKEDGWYHGKDYVNKDAVFPYPLLLGELCLFFKKTLVKAKVEVDVVVGPTVGGALMTQWLAAHLSDKHGGKQVVAVFADEEDVLQSEHLCLIDGVPDGTAKKLKEKGIEFDTSCSGKGIIKLSDVRGQVEIITCCDNSELINYQRKIDTKRIIKRGYPKFVQGAEVVIVEDIINRGATVAKTKLAVEAAGGRVVGVVCLCNRSGGKVTAETLGVTFLLSLMDVDMMMHKEEDCPDCLEFGPLSVRQDLGKGKEFLQRIGLGN